MDSNEKILQHVANMRSSDPAVRHVAVQNVSLICSRIGTQRIIYEFIPYIIESCCFGEDELVRIIQQLSDIDFTQMDSSDIYKMLLKMKYFAEVSSKTVRTEFIEFVEKVTAATRDLGQLIVWFISEMFAEMWYVFHLTGIGLLDKFRSQIQNKDFNELFVKAGSVIDSEIMELVLEYIRLCEKSIDNLNKNVLNNVLNQMNKFSQHNSMSVLCEIPKFYALYAAKKGSVDKMFQMSMGFWNNFNWRVRLSFLTSMRDYMKLENPPYENIFNVIYEVLLDQGEEEEIKLSVSELLSDFAIYNDINKEKLITIINNSFIESNKNFRLLLANYIIKYKDILDIEFIKDVLLKLASDESQDVKTSAFISLNSLNLMDEKLLNDFIEKNYNWREKRNIPKLLPKLKDSSSLSEILSHLLQDDSYEVRKETINILPELISSFGDEIIPTIILPILENLSKSSDYKLRQTAIISITRIGYYETGGLSILNSALRDSVSNVRLTLALHVDRSCTGILSKLQTDSDEEVRNSASLPRAP